MKKKEQLPAIWVEEKEYSDRSEFRVCVRARYPTGLNRPGVYEHYLQEWFSSGHCCGCEDYVFTVYKKINLWNRLLRKDYGYFKAKAVHACCKLIDEYRKDNEVPIVKNVGTDILLTNLK